MLMMLRLLVCGFGIWVGWFSLLFGCVCYLGLGGCLVVVVFVIVRVWRLFVFVGVGGCWFVVFRGYVCFLFWCLCCVLGFGLGWFVVCWMGLVLLVVGLMCFVFCCFC